MKPWDAQAKNGLCFMTTEYPQFQLIHALESGLPILNAASAGDIPKLGRFGAVNLEVRTKDQLRQMGLPVPENYVNGSVFSLPYEDGHFQTVVLGEFLEHCTETAAHRAIKECSRVLKPLGHLVITVPLDGRPNGKNRPNGRSQPDESEGEDPDGLVNASESGEWSDGVTVHHQTWWSNRMLHDLRESGNFDEIARSALLYCFTSPVGGWGLVWSKRSS